MEEPGDRDAVHSPDPDMLAAVAKKLADHDLEVIVGGSP
jgi:hypothetical protein